MTIHEDRNTVYSPSYIPPEPKRPREIEVIVTELPLAPCCAGYFPHLPDFPRAFGYGAPTPRREVDGRGRLRTTARTGGNWSDV